MDLIIKTVKREQVQANHTTKPVLNTILAAPGLLFFPLYLALACPFFYSSGWSLSHSVTELLLQHHSQLTTIFLSLSLSTLYSSLPLYINHHTLGLHSFVFIFPIFLLSPNSHSNQLDCI